MTTEFSTSLVSVSVSVREAAVRREADATLLFDYTTGSIYAGWVHLAALAAVAAVIAGLAQRAREGTLDFGRPRRRTFGSAGEVSSAASSARRNVRAIAAHNPVAQRTRAVGQSELNATLPEWKAPRAARVEA
ncbi:MAG: hypothetical protein JWQ68_1760 [Cryobacterium sp.]|nr:hypothetical protein [Cryobacterium sp.]